VIRAASLAAGLALCAASGAIAQDAAVLLSDHVWKAPGLPLVGGLSALEVYSGGDRILALSDRATLITATLTRDPDGAITGTTVTGMAPLTNPTAGRPVDPGGFDAEGLAHAPDGTLWVSFEGDHRIAAHAPDGREIRRLPPPSGAADLPRNGSYEALAVDRQGRLYTIPERTRAGQPAALSRLEHGQWQTIALVPAQGGYQPVGLDFDDRGRLFMLERRLGALGSFGSRIIRFPLTSGRVEGGTVVLETPAGAHGNLEGISLWRDGSGRLIATLIADNNFGSLLRSEIVEYYLPE